MRLRKGEALAAGISIFLVGGEVVGVEFVGGEVVAW